MKSKAKIALSLALACSGMTLLAAPLRRADVASEPAWVAHLDCDGLRTTGLGHYLESEMNKPAIQDKLAAFQALFSFDLRTQLHGLTLYSTGTAPQDGVLLVYADFDPERLVTLAKAAKEARHTSYKQSVIYSWLDEKKAHRGRNARVYAAIAGGRVLFGQREERVAQALDVLDGAAANLGAGTNFPQLGVPGETSFIEAAARKLQLPDQDSHAAVLKMSKQVALRVGETQGHVTATLTLEADDEEVATNMCSIAQGVLSLMKLQKDKPGQARLAQAATLKQDGARVTVAFNVPVNYMVEVLKAREARRAAREAEKN